MRLALTRRADYAVRACLYLATVEHGEPVPGRVIAEAMDIPVRFVPQILGDLTRASVVDSVNGQRGGYRLARPAADLSLLDCIEAVEGPTISTQLRSRNAGLSPGGLVRRPLSMDGGAGRVRCRAGAARPRGCRGSVHRAVLSWMGSVAQEGVLRMKLSIRMPRLMAVAIAADARSRCRGWSIRPGGIGRGPVDGAHGQHGPAAAAGAASRS